MVVLFFFSMIELFDPWDQYLLSVWKVPSFPAEHPFAGRYIKLNQYLLSKRACVVCRGAWWLGFITRLRGTFYGMLRLVVKIKPSNLLATTADWLTHHKDELIKQSHTMNKVMLPGPRQRSLYIVHLAMLIFSLGNSIIFTGVWPYLQEVVFAFSLLLHWSLPFLQV